MELDFYNIVGLIGTVFYFSSYALLNLNKVQGNSYIYIGMNLLGAAFVLFSLLKHWNLSSVIIQSGWIIFSVIGIINIYHRRKKEKEDKLSRDEEISI